MMGFGSSEFLIDIVGALGFLPRRSYFHYAYFMRLLYPRCGKETARMCGFLWCLYGQRDGSGIVEVECRHCAGIVPAL